MSAEIKREIENIDFDLTELSSFEMSAKRVNVKILLTSEMNRLTQKKNQLLKDLKDKYSSEANPEESQRKSWGDKQPAVGSVVVTNYMWDQSNDFVKVYIEAAKNDNLHMDDIKMRFDGKRSFTVFFGKYKFTISKLFDDIDADNSYHKLSKSGKLIIYLKKYNSKIWSSIDHKFDKFKKALDDEKEDMSADPSAGLMKLMKQMYDEGDDDMKRTIAKSWYESRQKNTSDIDMNSNDGLNI